MAEYKATPEQWEVQEKFFPESEDATCLLELRSRVETLEDNFESFFESTNFCINAIIDRVEKLEMGAGIRDIVAEGVKDTFNPTLNSDQIRSLLVERVVEVLDEHHVVGALDKSWHQQARAAINEIAEWLAENSGGTRAAWMLERELER